MSLAQFSDKKERVVLNLYNSCPEVTFTSNWCWFFCWFWFGWIFHPKRVKNNKFTPKFQIGKQKLVNNLGINFNFKTSKTKCNLALKCFELTLRICSTLEIKTFEWEAFLHFNSSLKSFFLLCRDRAVYMEKICTMSLELLFLLWNQTTPELKLFFQEKLFIFGQILLQKGKNIENNLLEFLWRIFIVDSRDQGIH